MENDALIPKIMKTMLTDFRLDWNLLQKYAELIYRTFNLPL